MRKIALMVEFGEACNEARCFKYWSLDKSLRDGMLEELADCLHFVLSLGVSLGVEKLPIVTLVNTVRDEFYSHSSTELLVEQSTGLFKLVVELDLEGTLAWVTLLRAFLEFCHSLGVEQSTLESAYWTKHEVNYRRQENGY